MIAGEMNAKPCSLQRGKSRPIGKQGEKQMVKKELGNRKKVQAIIKGQPALYSPFLPLQILSSY